MPMKADNGMENQEPVRSLLREWKVTTPLPPRFAEGVWRRIEQADTSAQTSAQLSLWDGFQHWLSTALPRPAIAVAYVTVLLMTGMATGYWQAHSESSRLKGELGTRYVQSVDPYQKPRL